MSTTAGARPAPGEAARFTREPHAHHAATIHPFAIVRDAATRGALAVGLVGVAAIHAVDGVGKWSETRYLFWMYMAACVASLVLAVALLLHPSRLTLLAAVGLAGSVLAGFVLSRTTGLPSATGDIGNWTEPLGLVSMIVEGMIVAVGVGGLVATRRSAVSAR